jgi:hypothetical protein
MEKATEQSELTKWKSTSHLPGDKKGIFQRVINLNIVKLIFLWNTKSIRKGLYAIVDITALKNAPWITRTEKYHA